MHTLIFFLFAFLALGACKPRTESSASQTKGNFGSDRSPFTIPPSVKVCRQDRFSPSSCLAFQASKEKNATWADSLILVYASKLAYMDADAVSSYAKQMDLDYFGTVIAGSDQAILLASDSSIIVAFRGTDPSLSDISTDTKCLYRTFSSGYSHCGFLTAFKRLKDQVYEKISQINQIKGRTLQVWFTGHSLGGAIANIFGYDFPETTRQKVYGVHTFGSPRVFSPALVDLSPRYIQNHMRFVFGNDIVTNVPGPTFFRHAGKVIYFTDRCEPKGNEDGWLPFLNRIIKQSPTTQAFNISGIPDHRLDNYIHCLETIAIRG